MANFTIVQLQSCAWSPLPAVDEDNLMRSDHIFSYLWPVNSIYGQTKGQNLISIAEMDSLGSITQVLTPCMERLNILPKMPRGGSDPHFFLRNQSKITNEACMQKSSSKTVDLLPPPNWALVIEFVIAPLSARIYVSFVACC